MISRLACPTVCVIDDEEKEYVPIIQALNSLNLGCVHFKGDSIANLPSTQLRGLRLVITDLHLNSSSTGKQSISHTANVFKRVVAADSAPVVVVIWSKYADDKSQSDLPPEDQLTEADLFKSVLLESEGQYRGRLIFVQMHKPKGDSPEDWVPKLKEQIQSTLQGYEAIDALFAWEAIVRDAANRVSEELTALAQPAQDESVVDNLQLIMQLLAHAQGGADCSASSAPRHLATVLGQSLIDQLEHSAMLSELTGHGTWLNDPKGNPKDGSVYASKLNEFLLTADATASAPFVPGTVYQIADSSFNTLFGIKVGGLVHDCYLDKGTTTCKEWRKLVRPVLVEISPECDVAQNTRRNALLLAGLIVPSNVCSNVKSGDAFQVLPTFSFRHKTDDFKDDTVCLIFCSRYKTTMLPDKEPDFLKPWFRLRELPTASLRNWHSGHASRVGYVSLKANTNIPTAAANEANAQ